MDLKKSRTVLSFFLPLLLSILPWFILQAELPDAQARQKADAQRQWLERARLIARRLPEVTTFQYWVEEASSRLSRRCERHLLSASARSGFSVSGFQRAIPAIDAELERRDIREVPRPIAWACLFPTRNGVPDLDASPPLLQGPHLETSYRSVFANLLREIARERGGLANSLCSLSMQNRLQQCFGDGVSPRLFDAGQEGKAFDVIWQSHYAVAVWRLLRHRGTIVGGFFLLYPIGEERYHLALQATLRHWGELFANSEILPVFLPFPTQGRHPSSKPLFSPRLRTRPALALISEFERNLRVHAVRESRPAPSSFASGSQGIPTRIGRIDLPLFDLASGKERHGWMTLPCILDTMSEHFGVLLSRSPAPPPIFLATITKVYGIFLFTGWGLFTALFMTGRHLPLPGVQTTLLLWFFALAGTPIALMITAGERLQFDLASNGRTALDGELSRLLRRAELGSLRGGNDFRLLGHQITTHPRFLSWVRRVRSNPRLQQRFLGHLFALFKRRHLELYSVIIMGPRRFSLCRFPSSIPTDLASAVVSFQNIFTDPVLNAPGNAALFAPDATDPASGSLFTEASTISSGSISDDPLKDSPSQMLMGSFNMINSPDTLVRAQLGSRQSLRYYNFCRQNNRSILFTVFDCGLDRTYAAYIQRTLHELHLRNRSVFFAVYRKTPDGVIPIAESGDQQGLAAIKRDLKPWGLVAEADGDRRAIFTTRRLPEYLFVAGTSLAPLQNWLLAQTGGIVLALLASLALLIGCAWALAQWLSTPIVEMTLGLQRVAGNDLEVRLDQRRPDELGEASETLNSMIDRLQERRMMSQFVAPQVLEVVADGDIDRACAGSERDVALLVSDIRSFTTMSEAYPPAEIFELLNHHFQAMTPIIQKHGGAIDRFIGDAVQAVFYAGPGEPPTSRALQAAIGMRQEHLRLCEQRRSAQRFTYDIGIGLEVGKVVTGVLGDPDVRLDFTVLGEAMKHAGELESCSRFGSSSRIVVSPAFRAHLDSSVPFQLLPRSSETVLQNDQAPWEYLENAGKLTISASFTANRPEGSFPRSAPTPVVPTSAGKHGPIESSAQPASAQQSLPGSSRTHVGLFLLAWIVPVLLIFWAFSTLQSDGQRRGMESLNTRLDNDLHLAEQCIEPRMLLSEYLRRSLSPIAQNQSASVAFEDIEHLLRKRFGQLEHELPGLGWCIFAAATPSTMIAPEPECFQHPGLSSKGGNFPTIDSSTLDSWFGDVMAMFPSPGRIASDTHLGKEKDRLLGKLGFSLLHQQAWEGFADVPLNGQPRLFLWFPIIDRELAEHLSAIPNRHRPRNQPWVLLNGHIRGIAFLFLPTSTLDHPDGLKRLVSLISHHGGRMAILPQNAGNARAGWCHPDFHRDPELRSLLQPGLRKHLAEISLSRWRTRVGEIIQNARWSIILARPAMSSQHRFPRLSAGLLFLGGIWFLFGIYGLSRLCFPVTGHRVSLRRRLAGTFALSLLPTFALGILVLERSALEQRSRAHIEQKQRLSDTVQAADEGRHLYVSWASALLNRHAVHPATIAALETLAARRQQPNALVPSALLEERWVSSFYWRLADQGLRILSPMFNDSRIGKTQLKIEFAKGRANESRFWRHLFTHQNALILQRLNPSEKSLSEGSGDPRIELMVDEMRSLLRVLFPPEHLAQLLSGPQTMSDFMFFGNEQEYLYRRFIRLGGQPRYAFLASVPTTSFDIPLLRRWFARPDMLDPERIWLSASLARFPERCWYPPVAQYKQEPQNSLSILSSYDLQHPRLVDLNRLSIIRECGVFGVLGSGTDSQLCLSQPGFISSNLQFTASVRIGELLARIDQSRASRHLLLGMLAILLAILARTVADRFLKPVSDLVAAARSITSGDLTPRLSATGVQEYLDLSSAFNAMAQGVAEGKLLSRFVSDSVRSAARDQGRHSAALAGEVQEATILFAGLDGYQKLLTALPPEQLVAITNRYLRRMSGAIRRHGGEIDKFIGDKILAVFSAERLGGRKAAALAGVLAADALLEAMQELRDELPLHLGIGLVTGPVLAGIVGSPAVRLEYTVIGDTVNLASRLCDTAQRLTRKENRPAAWEGQPGGIVIELATQDAVRASGDVSFEARFERLALPPIKGKTHAVETLLVRHVQPRRGRPRPRALSRPGAKPSTP